MSEEFKNLERADDIKLLKFPDSVRQRIGMYLGGTDAESINNLLREIIDNSIDECQKTADKVFIDRNFNGFNIVADNGRGISIEYNKDAPGIISADLSISTLHSGSKFTDNKSNTSGQNGVGSSAVNAVSQDYILLSKITPLNFDKSLKEVYDLWNSCGPRSKKDLFYIVWYKKGIKYFEGAAKKSEIEKQLFGHLGTWKEIPSGMSTIVLFNPDPELFTETTRMDIPIQNLQYSLLIQEKFYKKKVSILVEGNEMNSSGFSGYRHEFIKQIIPEDTSMNEKIDLFVSFEVDPELGNKDTCGSINSLKVDHGVHLNYVEDCFTKALKEQFGIKHKYLSNGLRLCVVALAAEVTFASQTKEKLKNFTKVKPSDFSPLIKEFQKIFRKDAEYWETHVGKLNYLAESMKSLSASEKAQKIIDNASGNSMYRSKADMVPGFSDATAGNSDRWGCELFLCFTGDTEILTCNNERISFIDLEKRINSGEEIYTFSCTSDGIIKPAKIIAANKIKKANKIATVTLDNGESFRCTPDHKLMMRDGTYKEAQELAVGDSMMPCYIREITDITSNGGDRFAVGTEFKRRVIKSVRTFDYGRPYKAVDKTSNEYYVYRLMSTHPDAIYHESLDKVTEGNPRIRHHIDHNTLNDVPKNLMWCSSSWHSAHHGSIAMINKAKEDNDLFNRVYVAPKQTKEYREGHSEKMKELYSSEKGDNLREHLRQKANLQWSSEELRAWRSNQTREFAKNNPEWVKENTLKCRNSFYRDTQIPLIKENLLQKNLELTSYNFNLEVYLVNLTNKRHFSYFDVIFNLNSDLLSDFIKVDNDSYDFILCNETLKILKNLELEVNCDNYNKIILSKFSPKGDTKVSQGRGYRAAKKKFPDLIKIYESELNNNHKILSVVINDIEEDVYCLEVDTPEHNFPLAAGIFAKNCEGLAAGGSLKAGRKGTLRHAILPLRGKVKNVKDSTADQMMDNKELFTIFKVLGLGIDANNVTHGCKTPEEAFEKIKKHARYGKICIATDADEDGLAIQNGLLYAISKFARFLLDFGLVYIAESPIFEQGGKYFYPSDPRQPGTQFPVGLNPNKYFRRFKGLKN